MKKPYEGLQPGTKAWMACWKKHPELQQEMLEYKQRLEEEKNDMVKNKKASKAVELEQQVEEAVKEVEKILQEEGFKEIVDPKEEKAMDKKKPEKPEKPGKMEQLRLFPSDRIVTVKDLAEELGTTPKALRKWLRKKMKRTSGRWEWEAGSLELDEIRVMYRIDHEK